MLTFTQLTPAAQFWQSGNLKQCIIDVTLDTLYASGGYSIPQSQQQIFGMLQVIGMQQIASPAGTLINLQWDKTNNKLLAYQTQTQAPLVMEEAVTVASNVGRLARVPGYILAVQVTAGTTTGQYRIIPSGQTPVTRQVAVDFYGGTLPGKLTFLSTDAVTAVKVTYIPMGVGPFQPSAFVLDEAVVFGSGAGDTFDLANRAGVIQYVYNSTASGASRLPAIQPVGESPATNQIAIDINNTGATTITNNNAQDTNAGLATYFKYTTGGFAAYGWTDDADLTLGATDTLNIVEDANVPGIWIPGFGCVLVGEATATNVQPIIQGPSGTAATTLAIYDFAKQVITFSDSVTTTAVPWLVLPAWAANLSGQEYVSGSNLSGFTARMRVVGR